MEFFMSTAVSGSKSREVVILQMSTCGGSLHMSREFMTS